MREFASTKYRLRNAPLWQKILYSSVLTFVGIGAATSLAMGLTRTGMTPAAVADYYRGNPDRMLFEKTFQELLETTHAHAFMMPIILLVLGHLFFLTDWPATPKRWVIVTAMASTFLMLVTPWAVRYGHPAWAVVNVLAGYAMGGSWAFLVLVPVYEMWFHDA